ncbi:MAG: ATP-binding protein [Desulfuromonadales bacterium]
MNLLYRFRQFHSSFRGRLFVIFTIVTGIISAAFVCLLITGEILDYRERSTEKAQLLASLLAGSVILPLYSENMSELNRLATGMLSTPHVARIFITSNDSRKLLDITAPRVVTNDVPLVTSSAQVIASAASPSAEAALSGVDHVVATPLGSVSVSVDADDMIVTIRSAILKTSGIALLFWMAVVAACYPVLTKVTRSFSTLTEGLDRMMAGNFSGTIIIDRDDEASHAAQAVNRLSATLIEREIENRSLQEELVNAMRQEVQEERRMMMAKLIQTNRMTSLGLLISSIAHNINTPNGAIRLAAQYLAASWKDALPILEQVTKEEGDFTLGGLPFGVARGEIKGASESILGNAERVERVIRDLRSYNLGERKELSPGVSVNRVVEEALTIIRAHGRQGEISITPVLSSQLPHITGNQYQLEQVVVNLLLNAMQSMPENKGAVTIRTAYSAEENEVRIIVTDQGEGVPPEVRKHLFEAFFTTRIDKGGSGLGLYISNFIVSEHKGRLSVDAGQDTGTVATVYLPTTADDSAL